MTIIVHILVHALRWYCTFNDIGFIRYGYCSVYEYEQ